MKNVNFLKLSMLILVVASTTPAWGQSSKRIVHDAEYYILEAQNGKA